VTAIEAIKERRSIRKFKTDAIPRELIEKVLAAAVQAPSALNKQPWRFVVLEGAKKDELAEAVLRKIEKVKWVNKKIESAASTARAMKQAPVIVLVFNAESKAKGLVRFFSSVLDVLHIQSIGGAIQTMLLAAQQLGLGTLWIGHVFFAMKETCRLVGRNQELVAAVAIGYADETPEPRPRKPWTEVTEWLR